LTFIMLTPRQSLLLALDPAEVLRAQGLTPDPWQQQLLTSTDRHILLNCSRQSGKSTTVAALALHTALFGPSALVLILSPTLRQSGELFRKVLAAYNALNRPVAALRHSQTRLELANGARVVCLPGREDTVRSFSGPALILIDEAARVPDDLYRGVRPMLAVSQGDLICLSTPFGQRGFFYDAWEQGGDSWKRIRITAQDCPRITPAFLDQERQSLGESWVKQEYECSFEALEGLVFPDFSSLVGFAPSGFAPTGKLVGGIDFGFRNPFAAIWGVLDRDDVLTITGERYVRETPLHEHAKHLPSGVTWYADPAGAQEIASLRQANVLVYKADNEIRLGIAAVQARLQTGRLRVVTQNCPDLMAEAQLYRYPTKGEGRSESEVPVDEHNHALAALRYLIAQIDHDFMAKLRKKDKPPTSVPVPTDRPWLRFDNEQLWR
jgi:hypothetical protein